MSFNLDEYVDVAERIRMFAEKYPEGSLQGDGYFVRSPEDTLIGYHYTARAYRTADDERPGVGTAYEPIPGKTQFTRDSEVQNAETAAWGRAIVALGFNTKKIASVEEVRARQTTSNLQDHNGNADDIAAPPGNFTPPAPKPPPADGGEPSEVVLTFGAHKGKKLGDLMAGNQKERGYVDWLAGKFEPQTADARRIKGAALTLVGGTPLALDTEDIPF